MSHLAYVARKLKAGNYNPFAHAAAALGGFEELKESNAPSGSMATRDFIEEKKILKYELVAFIYEACALYGNERIFNGWAALEGKFPGRNGDFIASELKKRIEKDENK